MPRFRDALYDGETVQLRTDQLRLAIHRRPIGWGWGELFTVTDDGDDRYLGVLEHLGEIDLERFPRPLQLVAEDVTVETDARGETDGLRFDLGVQELSEIEDFRDAEGYDAFPEVTGHLTLTRRSDRRIGFDLAIECHDHVEVTLLRGPWLRMGADGAGAVRDDGIFPGIDWVTGDEWSSGTDHIGHPAALRVSPHPNKVTIPVLAVAHEGIGVGLSWDPTATDPDLGRIQPVYATPNFVDRRNDNLMGLMRPGADAHGVDENAVEGTSPVGVEAGTTTGIAGEVCLIEGSSLDVVVDWVSRQGFPDPGQPRYEWVELVDWIAECYATNLWIDGEGFGANVGMIDGGTPTVPQFVRRYVDRPDADPDLVDRLEDKIAWCETQGDSDEGLPTRIHHPLDLAMRVDQDGTELGEALLDIRRDDGAFTFDPDGRHHTFRQEWLRYTRPLAQPGETDLGLCVGGAAALLLVGRKTGEQRFVAAGLETLEFATRFEKPAGDDWWETPLHAPNLLAGGKAAIAHALAFEQTDAPHHREQAVHWLRSLLPFTHLWGHDDRDLLYNTKPCFAASIWTVISWVNNHVIWEVLEVFERLDRLDIDPASIDPALDWHTYHRGITTAVLRWVIDSRADEEYLQKFAFPTQRTRAGEFDGLYADIHDPVDGTYSGGPIMPSVIGTNAMILLDREGA